MAQDSSGSHIVMWLPALAWVNFDMKGMGDLEWHSDTRPLHYFENIMPKAQTKLTPTQSPYGRQVMTAAISTSMSTPHVTSASHPTSGSGALSQTGVPHITHQDEEDGNDTLSSIGKHRSVVYLYYDDSKPPPDVANGDNSKWYLCLHCPMDVPTWACTSIEASAPGCQKHE